uniref:acetyl-CoA carboxylase biotin carboxylase subunit n=1 Tax=Tenacibaculum sp. TaxID=1906242 RepID=UPI003D0E9BAE
IEKMGDKIYSKKIAKKANVPTLDPVYIAELSDDEIIKQVKKMTYPVLIKASAGGGGRGMKRIDQEKDLLGAITVLKQEAKAAFGDETLFIEKFITNPRHIEVQILADKHGNVIHVGERDCTIQRRFQKILEEAPSPVLSDKKREEICSAAVRLAKSVNYDSVGTVEFLYDLDSEQFYFMEMNTRIQVEHPITEEVVDYDLIREQILVAAGVPISGKNYKPQLHSIECRINAEDPYNGFRPAPGKITSYHAPGGHGVRIDTHVYAGYIIPPNYDSMIAKLIVTAQTREEAINKMKRALDEYVIEGVKTTIPFHRQLMDHPDYVAGNYTTKFMEDFEMEA